MYDIEMAYYDIVSKKIFFKRYGNDLIFKSKRSYTFEEKDSDIMGFEGEVLGIKPSYQPRKAMLQIAQVLDHPDKSIFDINTTINLVKFKIIHKNLISNLRRKK